MNVAALALEGSQLVIDPAIDVNETAAIAYLARESGIPDVEGKSAAVIIGGGSPKNFLLQTQPQIHEVETLHVTSRSGDNTVWLFLLTCTRFSRS